MWQGWSCYAVIQGGVVVIPNHFVVFKMFFDRRGFLTVFGYLIADIPGRLLRFGKDRLFFVGLGRF